MVITQRDKWRPELEHLLHHGNVPVAVALTDIDGFAQLNADLGSAEGDRVLKFWEKTVNSNTPRDAVVARLGGDEFGVVLPGSSAESALILMEEIRTHFAEHSQGVDVSVGIAAAPPHGSTADDLIRAAGEALMRAKREGRGRVAIYVEEKMTLKSNYYSRANLDRLSKLSGATSRTEASLLREALDDLFEKYRNDL